MSKHTPGPWKFYKDKLRPQLSDRVVMEVQDSCQRAIVPWTGFDCANQPWAEKEANARFIVLACNNFEEMYEALKEAKAALFAFHFNDAMKWGVGMDKSREYVLERPIIHKLAALLARIEGEK